MHFFEIRKRAMNFLQKKSLAASKRFLGIGDWLGVEGVDIFAFGRLKLQKTTNYLSLVLHSLNTTRKPKPLVFLERIEG